MALSNTAVPKYYGAFRDAVIRGEIPVSYQTVYRTLIKHEIPRTAPKKEKDERPRCQKRSFCYALVLMLYTFGYHTKEIAEAAGASSSGVHTAATRRGLIAPKKRNAKRPEDIEKDRSRPKRKRGCKKFAAIGGSW